MSEEMKNLKISNYSALFAFLTRHFEWREAPREIFLDVTQDFSSLALVEMTGWAVTKIILFMLLGILLTGCSASVPPEMRALMVGEADIPREWIIFKQSTATDWGGELYNVAFAYGNDPTDPALEQQLIVYTDETAAKAGFEEYSDYMFVPEWQTPAEATFAPAAPADLFAYKCVTREIEHVMLTNCFILQQHGVYVSALGVQMGGPVTFESVDAVLKAIDEKLAGVSE